MPIWEVALRGLYAVKNDCWEWQGTLTSQGYAAPSISGLHNVNRKMYSDTGLVKRTPVHQQIAKTHPTFKEGMEARHLCGNRKCVNPAHILPGTKHENMQDAVLHRTHNKVRLTPEQALEVRGSSADYKEIADTYGISRAQVSTIKTGRSWGWLHA